VKLDPRAEVDFRVRLAREYLEDADKRLREEDFRGCVQYSQLAVENAAKAVIATCRIPSWAHDPSEELMQIQGEFPAEDRGKITRLAEISSKLAPEHGRTTYGEPDRFLTPRMLYDQKAARQALGLAGRLSRLCLRFWQAGVRSPQFLSSPEIQSPSYNYLSASSSGSTRTRGIAGWSLND
jgi:HEPN domain-containing protein